MALCTQGPQDMEVIVLDNHRTDVAQEQAQQGQLDFRRGHLPVTKEDNVLQRQEASQADMVAEGCKLGRVRRAIPSTAIQHVKPHRQAPIASGQGEELQWLQPLPCWVVTWL